MIYAQCMRRAATIPVVFVISQLVFGGDLHTAARAGDIDKVRELLASGASPNERDSLGGTPLHDAAWSGDLALITLLLTHGADSNARHLESGSTPLHYAVITNHKPAV